ncbi:transposase [Rhodococcus sp. NPDC019647]|uniref:transposase n=1 Tax=Rhodococcus sp. NPDC019647 TaxID=3364507 RepID=UPI00379948C1
MAEVGDDPARFATANGLRAFAGTAPITRASGRSHYVIPEGAGPVKGAVQAVPASMRTAPGKGHRSRCSARSAARTNDLDGGP